MQILPTFLYQPPKTYRAYWPKTQSCSAVNLGKMLLRRELDALSAPFKCSSDSESDTRHGSSTTSALTNKNSDKKKNKKSAKIKDELDEISCDEQRDRLYSRPSGIIEEEPDSMDSMINDPSAYPITIVPIQSPTASGAAGVLIRSATAQSSVSRLSRISSSSKYVYSIPIRMYNAMMIGFILNLFQFRISLLLHKQMVYIFIYSWYMKKRRR